MRLIDADTLPVHKAYCVDEAGWGANFYVVDKSDIDNALTIDAVPVVRCKDCVNYCGFDHCKNGICDVDSVSKRAVYPDDFCSYGERRSDD